MKEIIDRLKSIEEGHDREVAKLNSQLRLLKQEVEDAKHMLWMNTEGPMDDLFRLARRAVAENERVRTRLALSIVAIILFAIVSVVVHLK